MLGELRRFKLTTESDKETEQLEKVLKEKNLSRKEIASILYGLRVQSGFEKSDFGI